MLTLRLQALLLTTALPDNVRQNTGEEAVSVIHAPESFATWVSYAVISSLMGSKLSLLMIYRSLERPLQVMMILEMTAWRLKTTRPAWPP